MGVICKGGRRYRVSRFGPEGGFGCVSAFGSGFAEAIEDGGSEPGRRGRLGYDEVEAEGIQAAHGGKEAGGCLAGIVARGEDFHGGILGRADGPAPGEEAGASGALPGVGVGGLGEEVEGGGGGVVAGEEAGGGGGGGKAEG